jgi:hypothetical protein
MPPTARATSGHTYFNCGRSGHFARECPAPKKNAAQGHITHLPRGPQKVAIAKTGCINYTTIEEIPEGEQVLTGTFSLNGQPVVFLFDSRASHDFINRACTQKHQLDIQHSDSSYMISTPRGRVATKHIVRKTPLNLGGKVFNVCLIILDGQGIDVILEMGWIKRHKALLDTAARVIHLDSPVHGSTAFQLSLPSIVPPLVHHTATQNLEDIPVACEFPDVFPEDLSGMPSDQDVEFTIELQPGIAPISKRPYMMTPKELAELKVQLKELLDKGYICLSSSPWGCPALFLKKDQS